jgi:hypothetical protein
LPRARFAAIESRIRGYLRTLSGWAGPEEARGRIMQIVRMFSEPADLGNRDDR